MNEKHKEAKTHLTGSAVHWAQVFSKLFPDGEIHVKVLKSGEGADPHGSCARVVGDLFGGPQQTHNLPQSKIYI